MRISLSLLLIISFFLGHSQESIPGLKSSKWRFRNIIVVGENLESHKFKQQLSEFNNCDKECFERKLRITVSNKTKFTVGVFPIRLEWRGNDTRYRWKTDSAFWDAFGTVEQELTVILIGLDGTVKLKQHEVLSLEELFSIIDSMPMRKAEIRKNN